MSIESKSMHITPVGGNVFADLGFEPEDAAALKAESQRIISEKLLGRRADISGPQADDSRPEGRPPEADSSEAAAGGSDSRRRRTGAAGNDSRTQ